MRCRGELGVTLAVAIALYGFALALRRPVAGGLLARRGHRRRLLQPWAARARVAGVDDGALPSSAAPGARAPTPSPRPSPCRTPWRFAAVGVRARGTRSRHCSPLVVQRTALEVRRIAARRRPREFPLSAAQPAMVHVARAAARDLDAVDPRPRIQRRTRAAGHAGAGHSRARDAREPHRRAGAEGHQRAAAAGAARAHRRARSRLARSAASRRSSTGSAS